MILKWFYPIWLIYILISGYVIKDTIINLFKKNFKISPLEFWLLSVYFGNFIIWIAYKTTRYTSYIVGALSFSFILYLLLILIVFNKKKSAVFSSTEKYSDKKIENSEDLVQQLQLLMYKDKPYKNSNIKLKDIASKLDVSSHLLSQLLNDNIGKSFSKFINEYRVEEAKLLITNNRKFTLEAIGFDAGFSSKSTFYATFKKMVGVTPAQFQK
jgi:AraC-like DNA-binding protein